LDLAPQYNAIQDNAWCCTAMGGAVHCLQYVNVCQCMMNIFKKMIDNKNTHDSIAAAGLLHMPEIGKHSQLSY